MLAPSSSRVHPGAPGALQTPCICMHTKRVSKTAKTTRWKRFLTVFWPTAPRVQEGSKWSQGVQIGSGRVQNAQIRPKLRPRPPRGGGSKNGRKIGFWGSTPGPNPSVGNPSGTLPGGPRATFRRFVSSMAHQSAAGTALELHSTLRLYGHQTRQVGPGCSQEVH